MNFHFMAILCRKMAAMAYIARSARLNPRRAGAFTFVNMLRKG